MVVPCTAQARTTHLLRAGASPSNRQRLRRVQPRHNRLRVGHLHRCLQRRRLAAHVRLRPQRLQRLHVHCLRQRLHVQRLRLRHGRQVHGWPCHGLPGHDVLRVCGAVLHLPHGCCIVGVHHAAGVRSHVWKGHRLLPGHVLLLLHVCSTGGSHLAAGLGVLAGLWQGQECTSLVQGCWDVC
jgi:hypothetical protein